MISSLGALLRVSLRRSRADWPIVLAAGVMCTLAATLLAAGVMYGDAVSLASLHRTLADAPATDVNVQAVARVTPDGFTALDGTVTAAFDDAFASVPGAVVRVGRSDSFALPGRTDSTVQDLAVLGFAEGIESHASLVAGTWPAAGGPADGPVPVAISDRVSEALGIGVGDLEHLESKISAGFIVSVQVVAVYRVDDPAAAFWWGDRQVLDGVQSSERFATYGPFLTTRDALLARATPSQLQVAWRAMPDYSRATLDGISDMRVRVGAMKGRIAATTGGTPAVSLSTDLPAILERTEQSLLVSRAGVLVLTIQLVILAVYAVLLSAALLVEHRRVDTTMLRSRGAGPYRIAEMAATEGVVLVVAAVVVGPWLALGALHLFDVVGPLADIGLGLDPVVGADAYLAAGGAGLLCLVALTVPAFLSSRSLAGVQGGLARGPTRNVGQRVGLDIALLVVAALGLSQLRQYGGPLTASVKGTVGVDPLLIATPAIGLLAGAIVALRLIPLAARVLERGTMRGRGLVPSLSARQVARRPLRYTRAALLLTLAMSMGVFAASYAATWTTSQDDQARYQVGADVRVDPSRRSDAIPAWGLGPAYAGIGGITASSQVARDNVQLPTGTADLVGIDAAAAPAVVTLRPDLAAAPLTGLFAPLAASRPALEAARLPGEPSALRVRAGLDLRTVDGADQPGVSTVADWPGITVSAVVRDRLGMLHRFAAPPTTLADRDPVVIPLGSKTGSTSASFAYPLDLVAIELSLSLPGGVSSDDASVSVAGVDAGTDGTWVPVDLALASGWRATTASFGQPHELAAARTDGDALTVSTGAPGLRVIPGRDEFGRGLVVSFAPATLSAVGRAATPVIATDSFVHATGRSIGETLAVTVGGISRVVRLAGAVQTFPATDATKPALIMDLPTLSLLDFEGSDATTTADEWWLAVDDARVPAVAAALRAAPLKSDLVLTRGERARALSSDPVALGVIGAFAIGFIAAAVFAILGFVVNAAVSARERVTEFALLQAVGLSSGQLSAWLSLESAGLATVSIVAGTGLGLVLVWVVLPFVTVTQAAVAPVPSVEVVVPWTTIAVLVVVSSLVLAATIVGISLLLRRTGLALALRMGED